MYVSHHLPYAVYVLRSLKDGFFYIGFTTDLGRRLTEHEQGESPATAPRRPFELVYSEYHCSKQDALRREGYFKTTAGKKALRLMLRNSLASWRSDRSSSPTSRGTEFPAL
jgi:putative endonuclease